MKLMTVILLLCGLSWAAPANAVDADDLAELVGYTIVDASHVDGEFEGSDFDKLVRLENGMIFEFLDYSYSYSYRPTAVVLALHLSLEELRKLSPNKQHKRPLTLYYLLIEDELYSVMRVR
jgi:hypothetical protein